MQGCPKLFYSQLVVHILRIPLGMSEDSRGKGKMKMRLN